MRACLCILTFLTAGFSLGQTHYKNGRCAQPPIIDGVIDDHVEWADAIHLPGFVNFQDGSPATEHTEAWLAYDRLYIYLAVRATESPAAIHADEYRVNTSLAGDDSISLSLDPSGSLGEFNTFTINPRGATSIFLAGGRAAKLEWAGEFVAKGRITTTGYEIETRIPWTLIKQPKAGLKDIRFNITRYHVHSQHTDTIAFTQNNLSNNTPVWEAVILPGNPVERTLKLLPFAYGGWDRQDGRISDAGLDMKMSLNNNVEMVGSINPDFRNIENQILSLDFSRFERLAGESRPFFLEGGNYMDSAIYASQRIPRFDEGVNVYGKLDDKTNFGFLNTDWNGKQRDLVLNMTRSTTVNENWRATLSDQQSPGDTNSAFLLRYQRTLGPYYVFLRDMGSQDSIVGHGEQRDASIGWNLSPWYANVGYVWAQAAFDPALGFIPETDLKGPNSGMNYYREFDKGPWANINFGANTTDYRHIDNSFYRSDRNAYTTFVHRNSKLSFSGSVDYANFEGQLDIFNNVAIKYPYNNNYRNISAGVTWGKAALTPYKSINFGGTYRILRNKLDVGLTGQLVTHDGYSDQIILSANYDLGQDRSLSGRIVKSGPNIGPYLAYRRAGNRGAEYFVLIGNPNTAQFRPAAVVKVTVPISVPIR